jgi:RND family efflux transporter MFP subunit
VLTHQALRAEQQPPAKEEGPPAAPPVTRKADPGAIKVRVVKPTPGGLERTTTQPGTVRPYEQQQVYAAISGYVKEVGVDIGDHVKKGQVLAVIDAPVLVTEMEQAAAALQLAKGQVEEAAARVVAAEAEFRAAQAKEQQVRAARQAAQATAIEATTAQSDVTVKESKIRQARATLTIAQAGTKMAQAALDKARLQVGFTRLLSSYNGVVTRRTVNIGDYIQPGEPGRRVPLLTVQRADLVRVVVQIPDRDVPITEPGASVEIKFDALPGQQFSAKVSRIGFAEDEATRTMPVEIDVPNPKGQVRPGMFGTVAVHLGKGRSDALRVPGECVYGRPTPSEGWLYVVRDGKAHRTRVRTGQWRGGKVEILAGLKPSDRVVINPEDLTGDVVPVKVEGAP